MDSMAELIYHIGQNIWRYRIRTPFNLGRLINCRHRLLGVKDRVPKVPKKISRFDHL